MSGPPILPLGPPGNRGAFSSSLREIADRLNSLTREEIAQAMEKLPTDVLEWAVSFEALWHPAGPGSPFAMPTTDGLPVCEVCQGDGWIAYPTFADAEKTQIRIRKVACPRGCALADPNEPGVLPDFPEKGDVMRALKARRIALRRPPRNRGGAAGIQGALP